MRMPTLLSPNVEAFVLVQHLNSLQHFVGHAESFTKVYNHYPRMTTSPSTPTSTSSTITTSKAETEKEALWEEDTG